MRGVACLREAIARDPQNVFPKGELALIYIDLGLDDWAEQLLDDAADPHGAWDDFLPFVRLKLHVYRNEQDEAVAIAKKYHGIADRGLVVTMPGKPASIRVCLDAIMPAIPYCIDLIGGPYLEGNPERVTIFRPPK